MKMVMDAKIWTCDVFNLTSMEESLSRNAYKAVKKPYRPAPGWMPARRILSRRR